MRSSGLPTSDSLSSWCSFASSASAAVLLPGEALVLEFRIDPDVITSPAVIVPVPEPATGALVALGLVAMAARWPRVA